MKYHIHPVRKEPEKCRANIKCDFQKSDEPPVPHYSTKAAAYKAIEQELSAKHGNLSTMKSRKQSQDFGTVPRKKLESLRKARLRNQYSLKEVNKMLEDFGDSTPFHAYFAGNREVTFNYDDTETERTFMYGGCGYIASELNRVTGKQIVLFTEDPERDFWQGHAAIKLSDGQYLDVTGTKDRSGFKTHFPDIESFEEREVSRAEFNEILKIETGDARDNLDPLEKAVLAKICQDIATDYHDDLGL